MPAAAVTVNETTDFSSSWTHATDLAAGTSQVNGTVSDLDVMHLTGLQSGAQTLTFTFTGSPTLAWGSASLSAGGEILYSFAPFRWDWDGVGSQAYAINYSAWGIGTPWFGSSGSTTTTVNLAIGNAFAGDLYIAITPWNSAPLSYSFNVPLAEAAPAPVPLPAAGPLLAIALGAGGLALRRGRKA